MSRASPQRARRPARNDPVPVALLEYRLIALLTHTASRIRRVVVAHDAWMVPAALVVWSSSENHTLERDYVQNHTFRLPELCDREKRQSGRSGPFDLSRSARGVARGRCRAGCRRG